MDLDHTIRMARAGDESARNALAAHLLPTVLAWCGRLGGPYVDREEAALDVIMTVLRRLDRLDGNDRLAVWTFGITRRIVASHRRRAWLWRWLPGPVPDRPDPARLPDADVAGREVARAVDALLDALPGAQREVVVLCDVEEHTQAEAAEMLGVPEGTVKSRLRLARARLRALAIENHPSLVPEFADD